jgi:hypothetical protein
VEFGFVNLAQTGGGDRVGKFLVKSEDAAIKFFFFNNSEGDRGGWNGGSLELDQFIQEILPKSSRAGESAWPTLMYVGPSSR